MEPVATPVPVQAPLPERNIPRAPGVATPGQRLRGDEERLSARISFSGYRLTTEGQDLVYQEDLDGEGRLVRVDGDRDIELLRGRATLTYDRIGGSEFSTHLDLEYRPRLNGEGRFDDQRLNALYLAWGLTESRRPGAPGSNFGVAVGRVAIREAGFAQADGAAVRFRPIESLHFGAFGGVTGNPYGFNWALQSAETFSTDWITGGAFARWRTGPFQASLAGVVTFSNVPQPPPDEGNTDRVYVHADAAWQPADDVSLFATGFLDLLPSGQLVQNAELVGSWTPDQWNLTLGVGRFSTVTYALSTGYTFIVDPARNTFDDIAPNNVPIVDGDGNAVVPFDSALLTAIYNQVRVSVGYRFTSELEGYVRANALIRDVSLALEQTEDELEGEVPLAPTLDFAPLRLLPAVGARYRNPDVIDVDGQATLVIDEQSQADAIIRFGVGRGLWGLYARADARYLFGAINALDGGFSLNYGFPRDWFPGLLQLRAAFRYFREEVQVERPLAEDQTGPLGPDEQRAVIPAQESLLGFAGVEWRL